MTKIKFCGLQTPEAVAEAVRLGVDYLGFVFAKSPRQVTISQAHALCQNVPATQQKIGVFVSPTLADIHTAVTQVPLDGVQIHGEIPALANELLVIEALGATDLGAIAKFHPEGKRHLLIDAPPATYVGGNGVPFDWQAFNRQLLPRNHWLAGGLTAENVAEAIAYFSPETVDVSSGIETAGVKDLQKMRAFYQAVKECS